jgi:hypothetical protein
MDRFDREFLQKATELGVIDAADAFAFALKLTPAETVDRVIEFAFANRHVDAGPHRALCPLADAFNAAQRETASA